MNLNPAFCEQEYNARAAVPDHVRHIRHWMEESQKVRIAEPCYLDVAYGAEAKQNLDFFPARRGGGAAPLMVFIHGGYWRSLDKSDFSFVAPAFTRAGIAVAVINYRLLPGVPLDRNWERSPPKPIWRQPIGLGWPRRRDPDLPES